MINELNKDRTWVTQLYFKPYASLKINVWLNLSRTSNLTIFVLSSITPLTPSCNHTKKFHFRLFETGHEKYFAFTITLHKARFLLISASCKFLAYHVDPSIVAWLDESMRHYPWWMCSSSCLLSSRALLFRASYLQIGAYAIDSNLDLWSC